MNRAKCGNVIEDEIRIFAKDTNPFDEKLKGFSNQDDQGRAGTALSLGTGGIQIPPTLQKSRAGPPRESFPP